MITTFIYFEYICTAIEYILHMTRFVILEWEILLSTYIWSCCTNSFDLMVTISLSCLQCWKVQRKYSLPPIKNILQNWNPKQKGMPMYDMQMDLFSHYVSGTVHVLFINKRMSDMLDTKQVFPLLIGTLWTKTYSCIVWKMKLSRYDDICRGC